VRKKSKTTKIIIFLILGNFFIYYTTIVAKCGSLSFSMKRLKISYGMIGVLKFDKNRLSASTFNYSYLLSSEDLIHNPDNHSFCSKGS